ncbi:meiosis 1 arrest protein [Patella vulgata]|uniref:meiosis 1 arrest protein n=1 Tax=Patella vulgata TaxID=6465 RepID=UPI0024A95FC7|nr:meiosis 1 arrest protein [Patella vulgata]
MVVSVNDGNNENYNSVNTSQTSSTSPTISTDPLPITGLIDAQILDNDPLGFHNLFYWWLTNDSSDSEHLHIVFSSAQGDIDESLSIKCDLYERLLSPTQLPFIESYTLHPDSASCKSVFPSTSKATGMTVPIHKIKITNLLPTTSVCESLVFGMPMIVQATTCWKVDWDELDKNQNNFKALCHLLLTKDLVMLGKLQPETNSKQKGGKQQDSLLLPRGTFLILPAPNGTLLVKSIAVRELILPFRERQSDEEIPEKSLNIVQTFLSQIDMSPLYNPLLQDSGLFECLKYKPKPTNCSNRQHKRQSNKSWPSPVPVKVTPGEPITLTSGYSNQSDFNNILLSRRSTFLTHLE